MTYEEAIQHYQTQSALAKALGIKGPSVAEWKANGTIPLTRQYQIEVLSGGKLKADRRSA